MTVGDAPGGALTTTFHPQPVTTATPTPPSATLTDWQRRIAAARLALLAEIDRLAEGGGRESAVRQLLAMATARSLPDHLRGLATIANSRGGKEGKRTLCRATVYNWLRQRDENPRDPFLAIAPKAPARKPVPAWAPALLGAYRTPQKRPLAEVLADGLALPDGVAPPSYGQARRFLDRVSIIERNRGRMGPRALKTLKPYIRRDDSGLNPLDVVLMDGHQFDAEVAHPFHGGPFRPEITTLIDARTRLVLGWSAGLAESAHAVMDAIRHGVSTYGLFAILYVDRGSGYHAAVISDETVGLLARLGARHEESLAYNSQARGRIERLHQTIWVRAARSLPTYIGAPMDAEASNKVHKLTRRDFEARGRKLLMPWPDFLAFCEARVAAYNSRPHRSLPKVVFPDGKRRHQSPLDAWNDHVARGFVPMRVTEAESLDLFRPHREAVTRRGLVQLMGNSYFHPALADHGGDRVIVAYDIHDAKRVWVKDLEGRLICVAEWEGNRRAFFPQNVVEMARDKRAEGRVRRLRIQAEEIEAERRGPALEARADEPLSVETEEIAERMLAAMQPPAPRELDGGYTLAIPGDVERPFFQDEESHIRWCLANPDKMTDLDRQVMAELRASPSARMLYGLDQQGENA